MQDNQATMLEDRIKTAAEITAACFLTDEDAFANALREFFDLTTKDVSVTIQVDDHIDAYEYERIKNTLKNGRKFSVNRKKSFHVSCNTYYDGHLMISMANNDILNVETFEELPSYEEYRNAAKTVSIKSLAETAEARHSLKSSIVNAAMHKSTEWFDLYCHRLSKARKGLFHKDLSTESINRHLKKDYPFIVYV